MEGAVLVDVVEFRLVRSTPFGGRLDRLEGSSKESRASSPNGFSVTPRSLGAVLYGFCWGRDERRVLDDAMEETDGLRGVRVACSESICCSEYSSEKTLGFEERPDIER
jgi:hypothetical protein